MATYINATAVNDAPTIANTRANQATSDESAINPFAGVTIADVDVGVTDSVKITLSNTAGTLSGAGLTSLGAGVYTLAAATPGTLSTELARLTFTPTPHLVTPGSTITTGFTLAVTQGTLTTTDASTSVIATAVNDVPTIANTHANQATSDEKAINPFAGVTIADVDVGVTDTVKITLSNTGGTLTGAGLTSVGAGVYTLAAASPGSLTTELAGLTFTPTPHLVAPGSTIATGFTVAVTQGTLTTTDATTSVIATAVNDTPSINGVSSSTNTTDEAPIKPFTSATVTTPDFGVTETVDIMLSTNGWASETDADGVFSGTGLTKTGAGSYTLIGAPNVVSSELQALTFTPTAHQAAPGQTVTTGVIVLDYQGNQSTGVATYINATAVNDPPKISGTMAGQVTTDYVPLKPFSSAWSAMWIPV